MDEIKRSEDLNSADPTDAGCEQVLKQVNLAAAVPCPVLQPAKVAAPAASSTSLVQSGEEAVVIADCKRVPSAGCRDIKRSKRSVRDVEVLNGDRKVFESVGRRK